MMDFFAVLSVPRRPWLMPDELKEKFHNLSGTVHPDRVHGADDNSKIEAGAAYIALNAAYQCLRDHKLRLGHLLLLETGAKPGDLKTIPDDVIALFSRVGLLLRQTAPLIEEKAAAVSPMIKARLLEKALPSIGMIASLRAEIEQGRVRLEGDLRTVDANWSGGISIPGTREMLLGEILRLYHGFGFLDRWAGQLQERMIQLTL